MNKVFDQLELIRYPQHKPRLQLRPSERKAPDWSVRLANLEWLPVCLTCLRYGPVPCRSAAELQSQMKRPVEQEEELSCPQLHLSNVYPRSMLTGKRSRVFLRSQSWRESDQEFLFDSCHLEVWPWPLQTFARQPRHQRCNWPRASEFHQSRVLVSLAF